MRKDVMAILDSSFYKGSSDRIQGATLFLQSLREQMRKPDSTATEEDKATITLLANIVEQEWLHRYSIKEKTL